MEVRVHLDFRPSAKFNFETFYYQLSLWSSTNTFVHTTDFDTYLMTILSISENSEAKNSYWAQFVENSFLKEKKNIFTLVFMYDLSGVLLRTKVNWDLARKLTLKNCFWFDFQAGHQLISEWTFCFLNLQLVELGTFWPNIGFFAISLTRFSNFNAPSKRIFAHFGGRIGH